MPLNSFWCQKKVFITGASGFVGAHLTQSLLQLGSHVIALVRDFDPQSRFFQEQIFQKVHIVQGNLVDFNLLERTLCEYEIDTVFHLGAQTIVETALRNPLETFESNIRGTYHLLEACRKHKDLVQRIVIASSDKAYGSSPVLPYTEEMPVNGTHPYDVSKSCGDLIAITYHKTYDLPIVIGRCSNIYGEGDLNWSRIVPSTIRSLFLNQPIELRSDGNLTREYLYVHDAVTAYLLMGENLYRKEVLGMVFNFGPDKRYSVLQLVEKIKKLMKKPNMEIKILNKTENEIKDQMLDSSKARNLLGWSVQYSLEEGLQKTVPWYVSYLKNFTMAMR